MISEPKRALPLVAAASLAVALGCGSTEQQTGQRQAESTRLMAQRLEEIAAGAHPKDHAYLNDRRVEYFRERVEYLRKSTGAMSRKGKGQILNTRFSLAGELLRAGESEEAAREYQDLLSSADPGLRNVRAP